MTGNPDARAGRYVRNFAEPDDVIELEGVVSRIVSMGGVAIAHNVHQPGWRWSTHVRPVVGTEWCETHHVGICLAGIARIQMADGLEFEIAAGEAFDVPARHDGWVVGDQPWESVDWTGVRSWIPERDVLADRVLATLVFTDIVGSTEIAGRLGDVRWGELVGVHEERVRDAISRFRGREVKQTGDGVLAMFDSPERAVRCALFLPEVAAGVDLEVRVGVHTGEVEVTDSDLRGLAVHETARIMALAGSSEVLVSSTTRGLVDGFDFADRGEHQLRGIGTPRRVFAVVG